jgi:hypothetical protein
MSSRQHFKAALFVAPSPACQSPDFAGDTPDANALSSIHLPTSGNPFKENPFIMTDYRVSPGEAQEDQVTAAIEKVTSQVPSSVFLGAAIASIIGSVCCKAANKNNEALFVGQWVAPFLILGLYNKMVKQHGSDATVRTLSESQ